MASLIAEDVVGFSLNGKFRERAGNRHPSRAPQGCYRCEGEDEWIAISVGSDEEWQSLCQSMGRQDLLDGRFATTPDRQRHHDDLDRAIEDWTKDHNKLELMQRLQELGIAAGAVQKIDEASKDPQLRHHTNGLRV